jgi:hypothetical protein
MLPIDMARISFHLDGVPTCFGAPERAIDTSIATVAATTQHQDTGVLECGHDYLFKYQWLNFAKVRQAPRGTAIADK